MGGPKRAASTEPGERPKSRASDLLDGIEGQMGDLEQGPNGTPRGPRLSLPDIGGGNGTSMSAFGSPAGGRDRSMIARLLAEYPDVDVAIPPYAEDEWSKEEARLYIETQGLIKPPRKKKGDKRTSEAHQRLVDERLRRRLKEVTELQTQLGLSAVRPFATTEVHEFVGTLEALATAATKNAGEIKNTRAVRVLTDVATKTTQVADVLKGALTPASFVEEDTIARRESGQLAALSKRLVKAGESSSLSEERNKELNDRLITASKAVVQAKDDVLRLNSENAALMMHLKESEAARVKAEHKAKEGVETGYKKADEAIAARVLHIMKIEGDLREEQEKCRVINLKMRKLRSKATRLERQKADMRKFTDKNTAEHASLKRGLNTAQLRERTYRQQNAWLRDQLDETVDALLGGDPSSSVSEESVKARLSEVYQQLLDIQKAYTDLSAGGRWQVDASRRATPGGTLTSPTKETPHTRKDRQSTPPKVETPRKELDTELEPEPEVELEAEAPAVEAPVAEAAEEPVIVNEELRALVEDLGGLARVRALCSSDDPELRQTALDAIEMIELDREAEEAGAADPSRAVVTPAEGDAGKVDGVEEEQYSDAGFSSEAQSTANTLGDTQNTEAYEDEEWEEEV